MSVVQKIIPSWISDTLSPVTSPLIKACTYSLSISFFGPFQNVSQPKTPSIFLKHCMLYQNDFKFKGYTDDTFPKSFLITCFHFSAL